MPKFNASEWLSKNIKTQPVSSPAASAGDDVELVTQRIEAAGVDITAGYENWRDLGFALSEEGGESYRGIYHRISRLNPDYNSDECDKQYTKCLKAHGSGITIKTFFQKAKECGISISTGKLSNSSILSKLSSDRNDNIHGKLSKTANDKIEEIDKTDNISLPVFYPTIKGQLPEFLQKIADMSNSDQDADMMILGTLTAISACLPNIHGVYAERTVYPNLFLFVTAPASSGKGRLSLCGQLVKPVHKELRELAEAENIEYKQKLSEYNADKNKADREKPEEPPMRMLFIPANSSATAVYQVLNENGGKGLILETEGDTLANTFDQDYGNYSDGFRKAFHHEKVSYIRRKDREYVDIEKPRLSALLSGTPRQVFSLIKDAENGLFSRFIFYNLDLKLIWMDVFAQNTDKTLDERFSALGEEFYDLYSILNKKDSELRFRTTEEQSKAFNQAFGHWQQEYCDTLGLEFAASARRLGLITFRIAMILSALRLLETGDFDSDIQCLDQDFQAALSISDVLFCHTAHIFQQLPKAPVSSSTSAKGTQLTILFNALPDEFKRTDLIKVAEMLSIPGSTADRYLRSWIDSRQLERTSHGQFKKL